MRQSEDERIIRLSLPQEECGGGSRFCDGVGHGILDRNAVGYFWDWKKELAVSGVVESYLVILSQLRRLPPLQVVSNSKFVSVGVGSPTGDKRSARMRSDSDRNMSALLTRITRQVSRMFDLNKIKMKTGSMAYVMEHRLYGLFFA